MLHNLLSVMSLMSILKGEVCYDRLGCFTDKAPWSGTLQRPVSCLPWSPEKINTRFLLYTRENPNNFQEVSAIKPNTIYASQFQTQRKSRFIIHGFTDTGEKAWISHMCKMMLQVEDVNCFCVDWSGGSLALYSQAANNIRVVGAEVAYFVSTLVHRLGYSPSNVHLIGHSLGGHAAGEAGKRQPGIGRITATTEVPGGVCDNPDPNICCLSSKYCSVFFRSAAYSPTKDANFPEASERITKLQERRARTGLDPAQPYFQDTPAEVRLDPSDALFVDVIHTDSSSTISNLGTGGFGISQRVGHLDFFPNGGKRMPGCEKVNVIKNGNIDDVIGVTEEFASCHHVRSIKYYTESIISPDGFIGYPSTSYLAFLGGTGFPCPIGGCPLMGHYADRYSGIAPTSQTFYLNTGDVQNFSRWRYRVTVRVVHTLEIMGYFDLSLQESNGQIHNHTIYKGLIKPDTSYTKFIDSEIEVGHLSRVTFVWNSDLPNNHHLTLGAYTVTLQYGKDGSLYSICDSITWTPGIQQTLSGCSSSTPL